MHGTPPDSGRLNPSELILPAYVLLRPEGVFINLSPPPAQDVLKLFIDRLFSNESRFAELDYACFLRLLIAKAKANLASIEQDIQTRNHEIAATQSGPGFARYLSMAEKVRAGTIKFTPEQQAGWQKIVNQFAPLVRDTDGLMKKYLALESEIKRWKQERETCGAGECCKIEEVLGDTVVRKISSNRGISALGDLPQQELRSKLQELGETHERIFWDNKGNLDWHFTIAEAPATPA
jgi:hypothetical protein